MKNLVTLIRLHKWRIDESTRKLADLESLADRFRRDIADIGDRLAAEARLAGDSVVSAAGYSSFMQAETARRATLEQSLIDLEREIAAARQRIATAYRELKSYQITVERKREHAKLKQARRQQAILDEIGQVVHRTRASRTFA